MKRILITEDQFKRLIENIVINEEVDDNITDFIIDNKLTTEEIKNQILHSLLPQKGRLIVFLKKNGYNYTDSVQIAQQYWKNNYPELFNDVYKNIIKKYNVNLVGTPEFTKWKEGIQKMIDRQNMNPDDLFKDLGLD